MQSSNIDKLVVQYYFRLVRNNTETEQMLHSLLMRIHKDHIKNIKPFLLLSQHPVTTEYGFGEQQINETLNAIDELNIPSIALWPNSDAGSDQEHTVEHDGSHLDGDNPDDIDLGLDGSGSSDPEYGDELVYTWSQTGGPSLDLSDNSEILPTFTAVNPNGGETQVYSFNLLVTDNYWIGEPPTLASHTDNSSVTVTVNPEPNGAPDADIDIVTEGSPDCDSEDWECDADITFPIDDIALDGEDGPRWQVPHDGTPETDLATIAYIGSGSSDPDDDMLDFLWDTGTPAEPYDDANGNGEYDFCEPYFDVNGDGIWNDGDPYTAQNIVVERGAGDHEFALTVTDPYSANNSTSIVVYYVC